MILTKIIFSSSQDPKIFLRAFTSTKKILYDFEKLFQDLEKIIFSTNKHPEIIFEKERQKRYTKHKREKFVTVATFEKVLVQQL